MQTPYVNIALLFVAALIALIASGWWLFGALRGVKSDTEKDAMTDDGALNIYQQQLGELKAELQNGAINQSEYDEARLEIGRRLSVAKNDARKIGFGDVKKNARIAFVGVILIGLLTVGLYVKFGSPFIPDMPFKQRELELLNRPPQSLNDNEILVILQQKARENPKDATPHVLIGKFLEGQGRDSEALRAFQAALRRDNRDAEALAELGGVILKLNGGIPDAEVTGSLKSALQINPKNLTAQYYLGIVQWDIGNHDGAFDIWGNAWASLPENSPNRFALISRIINEISQIQMPKEGGMAAMMGGKNQQDFISSMVAQRGAKLAANPSDIGLRLSLARVNLMLQKPQEARKILTQGQNYTGADPFKSAIFSQAVAMIGDDGQNK